jgi:hypothetical protein
MRTRESRKINLDDMVIENKNPLEIFSEFYKLQNNKEMDNEQKEIIKKIIGRSLGGKINETFKINCFWLWALR